MSRKSARTARDRDCVQLAMGRVSSLRISPRKLQPRREPARRMLPLATQLGMADPHFSRHRRVATMVEEALIYACLTSFLSRFLCNYHACVVISQVSGIDFLTPV